MKYVRLLSKSRGGISQRVSLCDMFQHLKCWRGGGEFTTRFRGRERPFFQAGSQHRYYYRRGGEGAAGTLRPAHPPPRVAHDIVLPADPEGRIEEASPDPPASR